MARELRFLKYTDLSLPDADPGGGSENVTIPQGASGVTIATTDDSLSLSIRPLGASNSGTWPSAVELLVTSDVEAAKDTLVAVWHDGSGNKPAILTYWSTTP